MTTRHKRILEHVLRRVVMVSIIIVVTSMAARRRGYRVGFDALVRCRDGHLFTTIWIPGVSVKSIKLGWARFQYCPIGRHWSLVKLVRVADLSDEDVLDARDHHDVRVP